MDKSKAISILVDNCIIDLSRTMRWDNKVKEVSVCESTHQVSVLGLTRRAMPEACRETWKLDQVKCLPTLGKLAKEGKLDLYTYSELDNENDRGKNCYAQPPGNVFRGVPFKHVPSPVERSYFQQMDMRTFSSNETVIDFCKWLINNKVEEIAERLKGSDYYPDQLVKNLKRVGRFRDLCRGLGEKQFSDAFHLWSGEVNEIKYFLTVDRKFIRVMTETKKIGLPCRPITPSDLLEKLKIEDREPFDYEEGKFFNFSGISW
jgi:hypothetical protein